MFQFHFVYSDGNSYDVKNVNYIAVKSSSGFITITEDKILTAFIPIRSMCLYTTNSVVSISDSELIRIDILKQES